MALDTITILATIIGGLTALASLVAGTRKVVKELRQPKGLRLGLEPAIGDPGCCVHITNYGPVEHYISRVGAMPAHLRPRWSVCTRRINPKGDLRKALAVSTVWATIDQTIEPGRRLSLLVPQPLPLDRELPDYELESRRGITRRYYEWLKQDQPGGPLPLVPYVLLGDGSVVFGKKTRISSRQPSAIEPVCKYGHRMTQHVAYQRKRLAATMTVYRHCEKCWCLWFRRSDKQSEANETTSSAIALNAATTLHDSRIIEKSVNDEIA